MKHARLVNFLIPLWCLAYYGLASAAPSFAHDVSALDYASLAVAAAAGLMGGILRTIVTMASSSRAVLDILRESRKDMVVALIAGLIAYFVIEGTRSFYDMPRDLRMLVIGSAGWMRIGFFGVLDRLAASALNKVDKQITGEVPPPSSATMPLGDK